MNKASLISLVCTSGNDKEIINLFDLFSGFCNLYNHFANHRWFFITKLQKGEITRLRLYLQTIASMAICARRFYPPKGGGRRHSLTPDNKLFRPIRNNRLGSGGCEWREKSTRFFIIDREIRLYAAADQEKTDLFCLAGRMYDICFMFYTGFKEVRPSLSSIKQCHLAHCTTKYFSMLTWN